jgi:hypothetical protein
MYRMKTRFSRWLMASRLLLVLLCTLAAKGSDAADQPEFPSQAFPYAKLAAGPGHVQLLPRHPFTFTMYGCPGELGGLQQMVAVMRDKGLGNGFDPGPSARAESQPLFEYLATVGWPIICYPGYADMQVKEGRCRLRDEDEKALHVLDRTGLFSAIQLGEWGYYFHNLSHNEGWWHDVYGPDFDTQKHLMKPAGLAGYDHKPANRQECYDILKDYFLTRNRYMRGRNLSVTGHSHYETYAAEWGALVVGLELGENIAFTQSKLAFARGASRQWRRPFSVQVSPWFHGSCTTSGPLRQEGQYARGLEAGHSLSFYERLWLHAWFAGAAMVTPENSSGIFFEQAQAPWKLTVHGEKAAEVFAFTRSHEQGIPFTPVALVLDHLAGFNGYQGRPWGILAKTPADQETYDLFNEQLFPGSDFIHQPPDPANPEASYLRPTPYGEMFDVLLSNVQADVLQAYPVIVLLGDIDFNPSLICELHRALRQGSRLLLQPRHRAALGEDLGRLQASGTVEILEPWVNPSTKRPTAISNARLAQLAADCLPVTIEGDAIQYQVNRTRHGWVIELINNAGVTKFPTKPAQVDPKAIATVRLRPRIPVLSAREWRANKNLAFDPDMMVAIPPGASVFVEWATSN